MKPALVFNMAGGGGGSGIKLSSIAVITQPQKLDYITGDTFDPTGMTVEATYSNGAKRMVTGFRWQPEIIEDDLGEITVIYTEDGISVQKHLSIRTQPKLVRIEIMVSPEKTEYEYLDSFDPTKMAVRAWYSDGSIQYPAAWTWKPERFSRIGEQEVTVSYSKDGVTVETSLPVNVYRKTIPYPEQAEALIYTGAAQRPTWTGLEAQRTATGAMEATGAGTYEVWFTPAEMYRWPDGTTEAVKVTWTIGKAPGEISLSVDTLELDSVNSSKTVTVTASEGALIGAISGDEEVAAVSVADGVLTVVGVKNGDAVIVVTAGESENYLPEEKTLSVSVRFYAEAFADNDWSTIIAACHTGEVPETWKVGDSKTMKILNDEGEEESYRIDIIGRYHDEYTDKTLAPLTLMMHGTTSAKYAMNGTAKNEGGIFQMTLMDKVEGMIALLPEEVQNGIRWITKAYNEGKGSTTVIYSSFKLFLLSWYEIIGEAPEVYCDEGQQYEFFENKANRKKLINGTGTAAPWWTRSADIEYADSFVSINASGGSTYSSVTSTRHVSFAFCF